MSESGRGTTPASESIQRDCVGMHVAGVPLNRMAAPLRGHCSSDLRTTSSLEHRVYKNMGEKLLPPPARQGTSSMWLALWFLYMHIRASALYQPYYRTTVGLARSAPSSLFQGNRIRVFSSAIYGRVCTLHARSVRLLSFSLHSRIRSHTYCYLLPRLRGYAENILWICSL